MGKAGKAKKQRIKTAATFKCSIPAGIDPTAVDNDDEDDDNNSDGDHDSKAESDILSSIRTLNVLGQRLDIYESKSMKSLRTVLFPLIVLQIKKGSHFESNQLDPVDDKAAGKELGIHKLEVLSRYK
jgi:hypothetical protein